MANIWHAVESGAWTAAPIPMDSRYVMVDRLTRHPAPRFSPRKRIVPVARSKNSRHEARLLLVRTGHVAAEQWFAVVYPGVGLHLNGAKVVTGLARLVDRDVVSLNGYGGDEWVFSTERLPEVVVYSGDPGMHCPRCKLPLEQGQRVVSCPTCRAQHHQDEAIGKPCWSYAPNCSHCAQGTSLTDPSYSWTPDEL